MDKAADGIAPGDPVDLWAGIAPGFAGRAVPWRIPAGRPAVTEPLPPASAPPRWDEPVLSLHPDAASLIGRLLDLRVMPMRVVEGPVAIDAGMVPSAPPSRLMLASGRTVPLRPDAAYLLVRLDGLRDRNRYTPDRLDLNRRIRLVDWLTPAGRGAMARLRLHDTWRAAGRFHGRVTGQEAARYLRYFDEMGTHLIASIDRGERLFQWFEVDPAFLASLPRAFAEAGGTDELVGGAAFGMAHLTRSPWVMRTGPILSASDEPVAHRIAAHAIWQGERADDPASLLSPGARSAVRRAAALAPLSAQSVIGVAFASQAAMLEDFRADAWSRIQRAGLCQRFPAVVQAGWQARERFRPASFMASAGLTGDEALCRAATPEVPPFAWVIDLARSPDIVDRGGGCFAFFAATDPAQGDAAACRVAGPGFDPARWTIAFVEGAATFTTDTGERRCLADGVWLDGGADGRPRLAAAPTEAGAGVLHALLPALVPHLSLMDRLRTPIVHREVDEAMRRSAAWLARLCAGDARLTALRDHAAKVAGDEGDGALLPVDGAVVRGCIDLLALPGDAAVLGGRMDAIGRRLPGVLPDASGGPQLRRLILVLAVLGACRRAGLPVATLDDLSPATLVGRLDHVRMALAGRSHAEGEGAEMPAEGEGI